MKRKHLPLLAGVAMALAAAMAIGYWWGRVAESDSPGAPVAAKEREVLYWYDPMVPDQHFDKPGKSPFMDMELVPKYADDAVSTGIAIDPAVRQNLGIRTVEVKRGSVPGAVSVPGTIGWDLRRERVVSARVDVVVDRLFVRTPFERVRAGQPLASILAPAWSTALAEAQALRSSGSAARELRSAAQARLRALGLPAGASIRDGRIVLVSPSDGVVSEIAAREGATAPAGTLLYRINGTDTVWLEASVPQADAGIAPGTHVEARVSALPGQVFEGRVETLLPQLDAGSRTQPARIVLDNRQGLLAPGMFAQVAVGPAGGGEELLVPADAVIFDGTQSRVIVQATDGRFRPVAVAVGRSAAGMTEILSGLHGGDRVVVSGQFLIDSEASLSGALERLAGGSGNAADRGPAMQPGAQDPHANHGGEQPPRQAGNGDGQVHEAPGQ